jgi:hypothetical protein
MDCPECRRVLRQRFPSVTVVHTDAAELRLPGRPFRVDCAVLTLRRRH